MPLVPYGVLPNQAFSLSSLAVSLSFTPIHSLSLLSCCLPLIHSLSLLSHCLSLIHSHSLPRSYPGTGPWLVASWIILGLFWHVLCLFRHDIRSPLAKVPTLTTSRDSPLAATELCLFCYFVFPWRLSLTPRPLTCGRYRSLPATKTKCRRDIIVQRKQNVEET